jgi:hypothetical protein
MSKSLTLTTAGMASGVLGLLLLAGAQGAADEVYVVSRIVQLPSGQSLKSSGTDIAWVDPGSHTYALADRTNQSVDIIDTQTKEIRQFFATPPFAGPVTVPANSAGPNGVIIVEHRDVWATDGPQGCTGTAKPFTCTAPGSIRVFDLASGQQKGLIYPPGARGRVDELCYNPSSDVVLAGVNATASFGDAFITFIKEDSFKHAGTILLDGSPSAAVNPNDGTLIKANGIEQCQANPRDGKFYLSIPDIGGGAGGHDGAVLRISGHAPFKVEKVFPIDAAATLCAGPAGLTIGPGHQILVGCNQKVPGNSLIIDDRNGKIIAKVATPTGAPDEVWYDPGSNHYYLAQAVPAIMAVEDAGDEDHAPKPDSNATTAMNSKNPAADPFKNEVYLPILSTGAASGICGMFGGDDTKGCIAIYSSGSLGKDDCLAEGEAVIAVDEDGNAEHRKVKCDRN